MSILAQRLRYALIAVALPVATHAAPIGNAISVTPAASSEGARGVVTLARGSEVDAYDRVRTGGSGATKLRFLDRSTLDVGPNALVTLDSFVYNADATASQASLTMARGAFRWVSGRSPKDAYDLKTPLATIGIRGTDIRVYADPEATTVRLQSGAIRACSRISGQCGEANRPGQGVRLWSDGRVETFGPGNQQSPPVRRAAAPPPPPPPGYPPQGGGGPDAADIIMPALALGIGIAGSRIGRAPRAPRYPHYPGNTAPGRPGGYQPPTQTAPGMTAPRAQAPAAPVYQAPAAQMPRTQAVRTLSRPARMPTAYEQQTYPMVQPIR